MPSKKTKKEEVQVSFLPEITQEELVSKHKRAAFFATLAVILFSFAIFAIFALIPWLNVKRQLAGVNRNIYEIDQALEGRTVEDMKRVQDLAAKVAEAKQRLDGRPAFPNASSVVENSALDEVVLKTLALDDKGSLMLSGTAQSYRALAKQILAWRAQAQIKDVRLTSASGGASADGLVSGVQFNASLTLMPDALEWSP